MVTEDVGVVSVSPRLRVGDVVEYDRLTAEPTPPTFTLHHDPLYQCGVTRVDGPQRCLVRDRFSLFPERSNGSVGSPTDKHQPHRGSSTTGTRARLLFIRYRRTSKNTSELDPGALRNQRGIDSRLLTN